MAFSSSFPLGTPHDLADGSAHFPEQRKFGRYYIFEFVNRTDYVTRYSAKYRSYYPTSS